MWGRAFEFISATQSYEAEAESENTTELRTDSVQKSGK